jgi:Immunoglobulin domain
MKLPAFLQTRLHWINLPGALLIALLQRTPVVQVAVTAEDFVLSSPIGAVLKSSVAAIASLGALHSLAGATTVTASSPTPLSGTVGTPIQTVVFGTAGTEAQPGSWHVTGTLPPGLAFGGENSVPISNLNITNPSLTGTPKTAGTFQLTLVAWEGANETILSTPAFTYTINVTGGATAPTITTQPQSQTVNAGVNVTFTTGVSGSPAPTFQWRKNSVNIAGATSAALTLTSVTTADAGTYSVVATNSSGSATSSNAVLTVNAAAAPTITAQPQSVTVNGGGTAALAVVATSATSYQWRKDGAALAGATSDTLILTGVSAANAGVYTVVVTNTAGSATSNGATLAVTSGQVSRISNLSVRTNLASGQLLTVGFVTSGPKNLLLRANGPALGSFFGLTGFYPDPKLAVINSGSGLTIAQNDDWAASLAPTFASLGAFPWVVGSKDAAIEPSITGPNTAQINGTGPGVILVEVYDADSSSSPSRLTNVSARNQVGTGADILISGFVIDGTAARTLLIRGIGPALHDVFGVNGQLADPLLEVHQTVNGQDTVIASNDNWNANLAAVFSQVGAYQFLPGSKDAALLITLPPGIYTAQVSGVNLGTGDGVVEVYEVP